MKDTILKLRSQGKTYSEIQKVVKCSKILISYYVNPDAKPNKHNRQNRNRFTRRTKYKNILGGKCEICGYNKCLNALEFHHKDPSKKEFEISGAIWGKKQYSGKYYTENQIIEEVHKCMLLCANCHAEIHSRNNFKEHSNPSVTQTSPHGGVTI